jgi:hypothetical protein
MSDRFVRVSKVEVVNINQITTIKKYREGYVFWTSDSGGGDKGTWVEPEYEKGFKIAIGWDRI